MEVSRFNWENFQARQNFMNRNLLIGLSIVILIALMFVIAIYVPTSIPSNEDFSGMYYADLALVHGVQIYDLPTMRVLAQVATPNVPADKFYMPPFLYPPWFTLSTFYLGWMTVDAAAVLWFEINLILLFLSIWFLTDGWSERARLIAFPLGLIFLPVIGSLTVGQFVFPVLLGVSILIYALRRENVALTTLGVVLTTFKPHLGALILLSVLGWLIANRSNFGRRSLRAIIVTGIVLVLISFSADPHWLIRYPSLLLGISSNYGQSQNASLCVKCANLPVLLSRWIFAGSLSKAALIALALFAVLVVLFFWVRSSLMKDPILLLNVTLIVTLIISPYLFNYDFIMLLIPIAVLWCESNLTQKIILGACYFVPTLALGILGRAGNITLLIATLIIAVLLFQRAKSQVDVPALTSYNTNT
jgi:glycosyl transferase family 87